MKAFASRGRDLVDIEGIIVRQTGKLDWTYIDIVPPSHESGIRVAFDVLMQ